MLADPRDHLNCMHTSKYCFLYLKYIQFLFANYTSIRLTDKSKKRPECFSFLKIYNHFNMNKAVVWLLQIIGNGLFSAFDGLLHFYFGDLGSGHKVGNQKAENVVRA